MFIRFADSVDRAFDIVKQRGIENIDGALIAIENEDGNIVIDNNIGKKGKYVGIVGFYPDDENRMQYRRQALDTDFSQAAPMKALIDKEYQDMLKVERVVETFPRSDNGQAPGATAPATRPCGRTKPPWSH